MCEKGRVGKPVTFIVEGAGFGLYGKLEVLVNCNSGFVPTSGRLLKGSATLAISFTPREAKPHIVELMFNGAIVPGSPFKCLVLDAAEVNLSREVLVKVSVGIQTSFVIPGQRNMGDPEVNVLSPLREVVTSSINTDEEGQFEEIVEDQQFEVRDPQQSTAGQQQPLVLSQQQSQQPVSVAVAGVPQQQPGVGVAGAGVNSVISSASDLPMQQSAMGSISQQQVAAPPPISAAAAGQMTSPPAANEKLEKQLILPTDRCFSIHNEERFQQVKYINRLPHILSFYKIFFLDFY